MLTVNLLRSETTSYTDHLIGPFLQLRDPTCRIPWCDAPATQADHATPAHRGGATCAGNGDGLCQRHNLVKEHPGWHLKVTDTGLTGTGGHTMTITTPTRQVYDSTAPPILGEGWPPADPVSARHHPASHEQLQEATTTFRSVSDGAPATPSRPDSAPTTLSRPDAPAANEFECEPPEPIPDDTWFIQELPPLPDDSSAGAGIPEHWIPDAEWFADGCPTAA